MKTSAWFKAIAAACLAPLAASCVLDGSRHSGRGHGSLSLDIRLEHQIRPLAKPASADTSFQLASLHILLTAPGEPARAYILAISGSPDTGAVPVWFRIDSLPALKSWRAKLFTLDAERGDTVHRDSMRFSILAGETTYITQSVAARFSILKVRLVSAVPDSMPDPIQYLRIRVDGVTRDSIAVGRTLRALDFPAGLPASGFAVGESGRILKARLGGTVWSTLNSGTRQTLNSVSFPPEDSLKGWVAGDGGLVLKTVDGGRNWSPQVSGTSENLKRILFPHDAGTGFAFGEAGSILKTRNGGSDWSEMRPGWFALSSGVAENLNAVHFSDSAVGWAVGNAGTLLRTSDGGARWTAAGSPSALDFHAVHFTGPGTGWVVGDGGITLKTTDNSSWRALVNASRRALYGVADAPSFVYAAGDSGEIRTITSTGNSWTGHETGTRQALRGIAFSGTVGCAVGDSGTYVRIVDGPVPSFATRHIAGAPRLNSVTLVSANTALAVGDGGIIFKTTNFQHATPTWTAQASGTQEDLTHVHFLDANAGYAVGRSGLLLKTTNGGTSWPIRDTASGGLRGVFAATPYIGYAVGQGGILFKTTAGAARWPNASWRSAHFIDNETGWLAGAGGAILVSRDGGRSWAPQVSNTAHDLLDIHFLDANNGQAVGNFGTACRTENGGLLWTCYNAGPAALSGVRVVSSGNNGVAYAVGKGIWKTSNFGRNGGQTWQLQAGTESFTLNAIDCASTACKAAGSRESVVETLTGASWTLESSGARQFDTVLTYKYLNPDTTHSLLLEGITHATLPLRGYQKWVPLLTSAGRDTTLSPQTMARCGFAGTPDCK